MARVRIYQLAKEIDISSKEMMDVLVDIGMDVKSPSSTIEESVADIVKQMIAERQKAAEPQPEPVAVEETAAETVVVDTSVSSGPRKPWSRSQSPQPPRVRQLNRKLSQRRPRRVKRRGLTRMPTGDSRARKG